MTNQSTSTTVRNVIKHIDNRIRNVFNKDVFSIYEGVVEQIDTANAQLTVRIPALNNTVFEECRVLTPCLNDASYIMPNITVNSQVLVGFTQFKLNYPIVLGQLNPLTAVHSGLTPNSIKMRCGNTSLSISTSGVEIRNGSSVISVTSGGITLDGDSVRAGGENLLDDDTGL